MIGKGIVIEVEIEECVFVLGFDVGNVFVCEMFV